MTKLIHIVGDSVAQIDRLRAALTARCLATALKGGNEDQPIDRFAAIPALLALALQRSGKPGLMMQAAQTGLQGRIDKAVSVRLGLPQIPQPNDLADLALAAFAITDRRIVEALEAVATDVGGYFPHRWARQPLPGCLLVTDANQPLAQSDLAMTACLRATRRNLGLSQTVPRKILSRSLDRRASLWIANPFLLDWLLAEGLAGDPGAAIPRRRLRASIHTVANADGSFGRYDTLASTALAILALHAFGDNGATIARAQQRLCELLDNDKKTQPCVPFFQATYDQTDQILFTDTESDFLNAVALLALMVVPGDCSDSAPSVVNAQVNASSPYDHANVRDYIAAYVLPILTTRPDDEYPVSMRDARNVPPVSVTQYLPVILHGRALPALFSPECINRFAAITGHLPGLLAGEYGMGFEIYLGNTEKNSDFSLCLTRDSNVHHVLMDHYSEHRPGAQPRPGLSPALSVHPAWRALQELCGAWDNPNRPEHHALHNLWLEFDLEQAECEIPIPGIFLGTPDGLTQAGFDGWIGVLLARLAGGSLPAPIIATMHTLFGHLPPGASISHLGMMLSRRADALRLNVKDLDRSGISGYLIDAGWRGDGSAVQHLIERYGPLAEDLTLAIDVSDGLLPRIGLEFHPLPGDECERHIGAFIRQLHADGLSLESKAAAIAAWHGPVDGDMLRRHAPAELLRLLNLRGIAYQNGAVRRVFHFKFVIEPDRPIEAKAYIGATFG